MSPLQGLVCPINIIPLVDKKDMEQDKAAELLEKYHNGTCTEHERAAVEAWYNFYGASSSSASADEDLEYRKKLIWNRVAGENTRTMVKFPLWRYIAAAVAAVAIMVSGLWFYNKNSQIKETEQTALVNDIAPGKNGATITLANGKVIALSDAKLGVIVGSELKYSDGSDVRYSSGSRFSGSLKGSQKPTGPVGVRSLTPSDLQGADGKAQILTASTAKGQTYRFTLPDGTKVWMNADSKLEFPSSFSVAGQRYVKLSGEGYFEVAKDKAHPFIVATDKQEVEVLGTHFNINSYNDEASVETTLLEGSVKVSLGRDPGLRARSAKGQAVDDSQSGEDVVLKPNQQSVLTGNVIKVRQANLEEEMAWKNGYFMFESEEIGPIMRKIARWYNLEIVYGSAIPTDKFWGTVSRFSNVSQVLKKLELTGKVHFKIEGRRITVNK